ncbi:hypothetical protein NQ317_007468 [Molorchus minor]|uniref:Cathepsin L n=1 Tax=Molorchus minor TaxID=1323400 RepID=A0ABQ9K2C6_9CUCU|nr:hypothetical protein NQ317_007468 [Molorchus minor]
MESAYAIKTNTMLTLSEQNLIDCSDNHGCSGGTIHKAFAYVVQNGIETEEDYPFTAVDGTCTFETSKVALQLSSYKTITKDSESELKKAVGTIGPVSVSIDASYFQLYTGGIFDESSCTTTVNHGVLVVGYGTEDGTPYWLVKNSWGADWGEEGFIKMVRDKNDQCGIALWGIKMKIILALVSLALAANAASDRTLWQDFKKTHGKTYRSALEETKRFAIFQDNLRKIEEHNKKFESGEKTYYLGVNQFADMSVKEFRETMLTPNITRPMSGGLFTAKDAVEVPDTIDWNSQGAVAPVKDQGNCGSCWAFSTTGAIESAYYLKNNELVRLSEQNLIDCSTPYGNGGCDGGLMQYAFAYVVDNGISTEETYAYAGLDESCQNKESFVQISSYVDIEQSEETLKAAVASVGPVAVAIYVDDMMFYLGGIFMENSCSKDLDHELLLVGYGTSNGQDYWYLKNSWGTTWGELGFLKMARNADDLCGIADCAAYPVL